MFKAIMKVQWKWSRAAVLVATIFGFALPLVSVRLILMEPTYSRVTPGQIIRSMQDAAGFYAFLAGFVGLSVAFLAWNPDQKGRHIYALSLPVSRARYALMRFGAGSLFLLVPALGVLLGCLVAAGVANIPTGMQAYPLELTMRYVLASFVSFAVFFAIASSSQRAAAYLLGGLSVFVLVAVLISAMGVNVDIIGRSMDFIFAQPGILSIFTGRWMLIDV
jgi:hypothetical protein